MSVSSSIHATVAPLILAASSTSSSLFDEISSRLEGSTGELFGDTNDNFVTHLFPKDCPNITGAMKSIISGFVSRSLGDEQSISTHLVDLLLYLSMPSDVKRKPSASLAAYDIALLEAWYRAACEVHGKGVNPFFTCHLLNV